MDEVYIVGMFGQFCNGDGCMVQVLKENYGIGGLLNNKKYMLLFIFNVFVEVFDNENEYLFVGKLVDDLLFL